MAKTNANVDKNTEKQKLSAKKFKTIKAKSVNKLKCSYDPNCDKEFSRSDIMQRHIRNKHILSNIVCNICSKSLTPSSYGGHLKTHKMRNSIPCPQCSSTFLSGSSMVRHIKTYHKIKINKDSDETDVSDIENEGENGNKQPVFKCQSCSNFYMSKFVLHKHICIAHPETANQCKNCEKYFLNTHTCTTTSICDLCGVISDSIDLLHIHKIEFHTNSEPMDTNEGEGASEPESDSQPKDAYDPGCASHPEGEVKRETKREGEREIEREVEREGEREVERKGESAVVLDFAICIVCGLIFENEQEKNIHTLTHLTSCSKCGLKSKTIQKAIEHSPCPEDSD